MPDPQKNFAIIPAAGSGSRLSKGSKKQFAKISGKPLFYFCLNSFQNSASVDEIVLVVPKEDIHFVRNETDIWKSSFAKPIKVVEGGSVRQSSVREGFRTIDKDAGIVVIHDAVRPFVKPSFVDKIVSEANKKKCVISALPSKDTLKTEDKGVVKNTMSRTSIWRAQTPQAFKYEILKDSYEKTRSTNKVFTDESQIVEHAGYEVHIIEGSEHNFKVTYPEDMELAKLMIANGWGDT